MLKGIFTTLAIATPTSVIKPFQEGACDFIIATTGSSHRVDVYVRNDAKELFRTITQIEVVGDEHGFGRVTVFQIPARDILGYLLQSGEEVELKMNVQSLEF